ncbi:MAG: GNAT family N-acetyltransferase [Pseudomonadales bacterium]
MIAIEPLSAATLPAYQAHFARHRAESGLGDIHFMPFDPDDPDGPRGLDSEAWQWPLQRPGWQRWFLAIAADGLVVGHVDLKSAPLKTSLHRVTLGIGIERPYRGAGLGRRLMQVAIRFAEEQPELDWLELQAFAHNSPGLALYQSLGFKEIGRVRDRFRIRGQHIDDVHMTLAVGSDQSEGL